MNGFQEFGKPDEILADHGTQFLASRKDKKGYAKHKFGAFLEENGIRRILARVVLCTAGYEKEPVQQCG